MAFGQKRTLSERRLLGTILELEGLGYRPSMDGVVAYLRGSETLPEPLKEGAFYGLYAPKASSKAIKGKLRSLLRSGDILLAYDEEMKDYLLSLSEKGRNFDPLIPKKRPTRPQKILFKRIGKK